MIGSKLEKTKKYRKVKKDQQTGKKIGSLKSRRPPKKGKKKPERE